MHAVALHPTQIVSLQECNKVKKLSRDLVEFLCSVNTHNSIDVLSLVLFWLRLGTSVYTFLCHLYFIIFFWLRLGTSVYNSVSFVFYYFLLAQTWYFGL